MIKLTVGSTDIKVYDHIELMKNLLSVGVESAEFDELNKFTLGVLPEGSYGKFLVNAASLATLKTGEFNVTLTITGQEDTFTHTCLMITEVRYFDMPIASVSGLSRHVAIVKVQDVFFALDDIIQEDYNISPIDDADVKTFQQIIDDILSNFPVGGSPVVATLTGLPAFSPRNVLSKGVRVRDFLQQVADAHYLVCYAKPSAATPGEIVITNALATGLIPAKAQLIYSEFGTEVMQSELEVTLGSYAAGEWNFDTYTATVIASDDAILPSNARYPTDVKESAFYPYFDNERFTAGGSETVIIGSQLATNFAKRTERVIKNVYKDVIDTVPSSSIQQINYRYTQAGLVTELRSMPVMRIDFNRLAGQTGTVEIEVTATRTAGSTGDDAPYNGLIIATGDVKRAPCALSGMLDTSIEVVDHAGCILDAGGDLIGIRVWATKGIARSLAPGAAATDNTPCHWCADNRCCTAAGG